MCLPSPLFRCEFIEDCEFTYLSTQILHLLGIEGPKTKDPGEQCCSRQEVEQAIPAPLSIPYSTEVAPAWHHWCLGPALEVTSPYSCLTLDPSPTHSHTHFPLPLPAPPLPPARYIRYIYNRVILENATVRAAALSSLAQFGAECEELRPRILILLRRALFDNDDEVRWEGRGVGGLEDGRGCRAWEGRVRWKWWWAGQGRGRDEWEGRRQQGGRHRCQQEGWVAWVACLGRLGLVACLLNH